MSKRKPKSDYNVVKSLLKAEGTESLKESVAKDLNAPDRPSKYCRNERCWSQMGSQRKNRRRTTSRRGSLYRLFGQKNG